MRVVDYDIQTVMYIRRETIGTTAGHAGQPPTLVETYTLDSGNGLAITVWTYGATLIEVNVPDRDGRTNNVVARLLSLTDYEDRKKNPYLGATVGRYARCIAGGRFHLDGVGYQLDLNEGRHHIHGGTIGFDRFVWAAQAEREGDRLWLRLSLDSPDGDQGYPGTLSAETVYEIDRQGRLTFEHLATTTASTVVGFTNHAYWNLAGSGTINDHLLTLNATHVVEVDGELIPVGPLVSVADTPLDYSVQRLLADQRLDHCFVLDDPTWAADLYHPASGRAMRVLTDQAGVGVYSADKFKKPRAGLCLETGSWPDSPNHHDYPSSRLDPGNIYRHRTIHEFSIR